MRELGHRLLQSAGHGDVVEILELARANKGAAAGEFEDVFELARAKVGVDLVGDRADQLEREEHDRIGDAIGQLQRHHVAALDAGPAEKLGAALDLVLELAVADAAERVAKNLALGMPARALLQYFEEGTVAPVPARPIGLRELRLDERFWLHAFSLNGHAAAGRRPPGSSFQ